uniref:Uncharacterized protein n=1 Tax=uncultured Thiotrichaceae bacterium TaxID=298394 RepID=A0A6S6SHQ4_9GAMM|nr:MAG: Unknown protein [uncultured Thiotrichaceae bacterium]
MQIQDQGFTPWISVPALDYIGTSMSTVEKPTVLVLYDSKQQRHLTPSTAPFDQLRIVLANGNRKINFHDTQSGLPIDSLNNRYAEIILTMNDGDLDSAYLHWLEGMEKRKHTIIRNTQGK